MSSEEAKLVAFLAAEKSEKKKICFLTIEYPPAKGGVSKSALRITDFLIEEGFELHVFTPSFTLTTFQVEIKRDGLYVYRIPTYSLAVFTHIITIVDQALSFDLFHGFFLFWSAALLPVIAADKRPLISSIRGIEAVWMKEGKDKAIYRKILKRSSWITSVSSDSLIVAGSLGQIKRKSSFIANSVKIKSGNWKKTSENTGVVGTAALFRKKKHTAPD